MNRKITYIISLIFIVSCGGGSGGSSPAITPPPPPTNPSITSFSSSEDSIYVNESILLSWASENTSSCSASGDWDGQKASGGSEAINPNEIRAYSFILTCSGSSGTQDATASVSVNVIAVPAPAPELSSYSFLKEDNDLLEEDISATNDDHIHFVCDVFNNPEDKLEYTYDFGDDWHHTITLLKIETNPYEYPALPAMIMAEGVAPPEDCGGVHEVNRILAEATDSTHPNHNESMEWVRENEIMSEPDIPMLVQRLGLSLLDMYDYYADLFKGEEDQDFED